MYRKLTDEEYELLKKELVQGFIDEILDSVGPRIEEACDRSNLRYYLTQEKDTDEITINWNWRFSVGFARGKLTKMRKTNAKVSGKKNVSNRGKK